MKLLLGCVNSAYSLVGYDWDRDGVFWLDEASGKVDQRIVGGRGEIYDVLPWYDDVMQPILRKYSSGVPL